MNDSIVFLLLTILCIVLQSLFSMFEMACLSFNRLRLQYYVSKKYKRAIWLNSLLKKPSNLFGVTLIGVNFFLLFGSESARHFYQSLNINPDFAPITQILVVLVFAELAPLFAARRYSEQVALTLVPIIFFISYLLKPVIWTIDSFSKVLNLIFGKGEKTSFLSKEEIQKIFEERSFSQRKNISQSVNHIFSLQNKSIKDLMLPLDSIKLLSSSAILNDVKNTLSINYLPYVPLYHEMTQNIVSIIYTKDLLNLKDNERVVSYAKAPWFILETDSILQILKQFRNNRQIVAIVLDKEGLARGILSLDQIIDNIFGEYRLLYEENITSKIIEKTILADTLVSYFNRQFNLKLKASDKETLNDLIIRTLGHLPTNGEVVYIEQFEITVLESSFLGAKTISIKTIV
jgi:putative hemolysin